MLNSGNIPKIISACKLEITSCDSAKLKIPMGLVLNAICFVLLFVMGINPKLGLKAMHLAPLQTAFWFVEF